MYRVIEVPEDAAEATEQLGSKPKFWFIDGEGKACLFKQGRPNTGENWAEKVSGEICGCLTIPHATYDLAIWRGIQGVVSPTFVPTDSRLVFGNELLGRIRGYVDETRYYHQSGHTVARVFGVLRDPRIQPPASWQPAEGISSAGGIFVGYLMLDALIGNTDRHHENWGLVVRASGAQPDVRLAPTFDHASSLGRNETDARRQARLVSKDPSFSIRSYAERARSALYKLPSDHRPLLTFDAFKEAVRIYPQAGRLWMRRLKEVEDDQLRFILEAIPPDFMTAVAREFAFRFLLASKERTISFADALP